MRKHAGTGFSLIEVLVSLLILSVGIIGAVSMQLNALRSSQQSGFHSAALQLALDTADQIRALTAVNISDAENPFLALDFKSGDSVVSPHEFCYDVSSVCNAAALTEFQIHEIQERLKLSLPNGRIKICRDAMPWDDTGNDYRWECRADSHGAPIVVKLSWRSPSNHTPSAREETDNPRLVILVQS